MFHIMWSRYLELDEAAFADYLSRLRDHVRVLRPVAVSDHLCRFRFDGLFVGAGQEHTYDDIAGIAERVARYQDAIGMQLLVENNASLEQPAAKQIEFLAELMHRTGCGLLFDISNAVVGELNGQGSFEQWLPLLAGRTLRCHVGSYTRDDLVGQYIDSHDADVTRETQAAVRRLVECADVRIESITYERDFNRSSEAIARDLVRIAESLCA